MIKSYKYIRPSQKRLYDLSYHLMNNSSLRLKAKVAKLVKIIPERYNYEVIFTKRRIWFVKADEKLIQLMVGEQRIYFKVKTNSDWLEIILHDWEDFERIFRIIKSQTWYL